MHAHRNMLWKERLIKALRDNYKRPYTLVENRNLVGLFMCIFVKDDLAPHISNVHSHLVSTGLGGTFGNKGGIVARMCIYQSSLCIVDAHLPAHQTKVAKRNADAWTIIKSTGLPPFADGPDALECVRGGTGTTVMDHEHCFFFGDLNYRIDLERDRVV